MTSTPSILTFFGENRFLSNFYPAKFEWKGLIWPNTECAYQAAKATSPDVFEDFVLMTAKEAKRIGRMIPMRSDWEQVKVEIMTEVVRAKFEQNPILKQKLLNTGNAWLEEGNTWGDRTWGVCPPGSGQGKNLLGRILMDLRSEFAGTNMLVF